MSRLSVFRRSWPCWLGACLMAGCVTPPADKPQPPSPPEVRGSVVVPAPPVQPPLLPPARPAPADPVLLPREPVAPTPAELEGRQVVELISYAQRAAGMSADEQRRELAAANQEHSREPGPRSRLRLALLLALPATPVSDEGRAATLLEPLASAPGSGPLRQFAALLHAQVSERAREQKRLAQLKEQIDGLRAIERSLIERDRGRK